VPVAGEDVAFGRASAPGKQRESKFNFALKSLLDPRRATSYHRYTIACQRFLKISSRLCKFLRKRKFSSWLSA
jgi:hypothetical protein